MPPPPKGVDAIEFTSKLQYINRTPSSRDQALTGILYVWSHLLTALCTAPSCRRAGTRLISSGAGIRRRRLFRTAAGVVGCGRCVVGGCAGRSPLRVLP